MTHPYMNWNL